MTSSSPAPVRSPLHPFWLRVEGELRARSTVGNTAPMSGEGGRPNICGRSQPHRAWIWTRVSSTGAFRCAGAGFRGPELGFGRTSVQSKLFDVLALYFEVAAGRQDGLGTACLSKSLGYSDSRPNPSSVRPAPAPDFRVTPFSVDVGVTFPTPLVELTPSTYPTSVSRRGAPLCGKV